MKFSDWVPIIVAVVTFVGVVTVPSLGGNRPRQQLEALKAVREAIAATDDRSVKKMLGKAERDLAVRIEARYRPWSKKTAWFYWAAFGAALLLLALTVLVGIFFPPAPPAPATRQSSAESDALWVTLMAFTGFAAFLGISTLGYRMVRRQVRYSSRSRLRRKIGRPGK